MIRNNIFALLLVAALAMVARPATFAGRAAAPALPVAQNTNAPVSTMPAHLKRVKFHGQVINQTSIFITVQSLDPDHLNELRTFSFSPGLKPKMQRILDVGGYQRGDKVVVTSLAGSNVALNVRGRPSKPV